MWTERSAMEDDPLIHAMQIVLNYNDSISRYMQDMVTGNNNDIEEAQNELKLKLRNSASNRVMFYKTVNPYFIVHDIYTNSGGSRDKILGGASMVKYIKLINQRIVMTFFCVSPALC